MASVDRFLKAINRHGLFTVEGIAARDRILGARVPYSTNHRVSGLDLDADSEALAIRIGWYSLSAVPILGVCQAIDIVEI